MSKPKNKKSSKNIIIPSDIADKWQNIVNLLADLEDVKASLILKITSDYIEILFASQNTDDPYETGEKQFISRNSYFEPVAKSRTELIIDNALSNPKWKNYITNNKGMISCICLQIKLPDNEPYGELCLLDNKAHRFSEDHIHMLKYFRELIQYQLNSIMSENILISKKSKKTKVNKNIPHFLHICSFCKRIKNKDNKWIPIEEFFARHIDLYFSHGICSECLQKHYGYLFKNKKQSKNNSKK